MIGSFIENKQKGNKDLNSIKARAQTWRISHDLSTMIAPHYKIHVSLMIFVCYDIALMFFCSSVWK